MITSFFPVICIWSCCSKISVGANQIEMNVIWWLKIGFAKFLLCFLANLHFAKKHRSSLGNGWNMIRRHEFGVCTDEISPTGPIFVYQGHRSNQIFEKSEISLISSDLHYLQLGQDRIHKIPTVVFGKFSFCLKTSQFVRKRLKHDQKTWIRGLYRGNIPNRTHLRVPGP